MLLLLAALYERVYHVPQHMQRLVYIAAFFESLPFHMRVLHPLTPRQVNYVQLRLPPSSRLLLHNLRLYTHSKYCMRSRTLLVHTRLRRLARLLALEQQVDRLLVGCYSEIAHPLNVDALLRGLSYLQGLKTFCQQVEYLLVVYLHV